MMGRRASCGGGVMGAVTAAVEVGVMAVVVVVVMETRVGVMEVVAV